MYGRIFSRQYISLALYPGLQIANSGGDDAKTESIRTPTAILADGIAATKPGRFAAQENGLTASGQGGSVSRSWSHTTVLLSSVSNSPPQPRPIRLSKRGPDIRQRIGGTHWTS
jgi:hypothetical protein